MNKDKEIVEKDMNSGHRARMREKFLSSKDAYLSFQEYEMLEMILFLAIPRSDVKKMAKNILEKYKTIANICATANEVLLKDKLLSESTIFAIKLVYECGKKILRSQIIENDILSSWSLIKEYIMMKIGILNYEVFFVIFLNNKNMLIHEQTFGSGTVDRSSLYVRELIKISLEINASKIIISHNHPSGSINPSNEDKIITKQIKDSCEIFDIELVDHVIVSSKDSFSFRKNAIL